MDFSLFFFFFFFFPKWSCASCPAKCECDTDEYNRKRVSCWNGGMNIPEDISMLDYDTRVVIISGFEGCRPNFVNFSPKLPNSMPVSRYLEELHLSFTDLESLGDKPFFQMSDTLLLLNLSYNAISTLSESNFNNLSKVTDLYLDYNQLTTMPPVSTFRFLINLKKLSLSSNHIDDISHVEIDYRDRRRQRAEIEVSENDPARSAFT
jgi:Leucine rich repeat